MNYGDCERHLSKSRMEKYKRACGGNEEKAFELYIQNIQASKNFYGTLSLFEVALRNAINEHYKNNLENDDWILNQADNGFFTEFNSKIHSFSRTSRRFLGKR